MKKIVYSVEKKRPGCVLIQAALGCDSSLAHLFPSESWIIHLDKTLKIYEVTDEQLEKLVAITEKGRTWERSSSSKSDSETIQKKCSNAS